MRRPALLIAIGLAGVAAAIALGAAVPDAYQLPVMAGGCLLSLAFAWGVAELSGEAWLLIPAFMVLIPGTAVLVGDGHRALMDLVARQETCVIERVEELTGRDTPAYAHTAYCPDGATLTIVVQGEADKRMPLGPVSVLRHEWMRPLLAERNDWSAEWVFGVPIATFLLLVCATGLRARRVMRQA